VAARPKVFLSHSKKDQEFIERLAADLRLAFVDVWYDDWEISPGDSLRKRIFSEGIPESDLFFIFITASSIKSYWCEKELDAAFVEEVGQRGGNLSVFADSDDSRSKLTPDLRSLRVPVIDEGSYERCVRMIVSSAWRAYSKRASNEVFQKSHVAILEAEKRIAELELERARSRAVDCGAVMKTLENRSLTYGKVELSLKDIFVGIADTLAAGANEATLRNRIGGMFGVKMGINDNPPPLRVSDVTGRLVILGLVAIRPPEGDWYEVIYLTEDGKRLAREIDAGAT